MVRNTRNSSPVPGQRFAKRSMSTEGWYGSEPGPGATSRDGREDVVEDPQGRARSQPFVVRAQQIFRGDHVEDRSDVLRHPAVHQDQAAGERLPKRVTTRRL